ncbi:hypothetical protein NBM05_10990 [Rothia sp. AR01]|uniref:Uncharacterized protein n=1 Tax=Rothia santali TaxID=2949643 RepID=A0A9X2HDY8_9MICC|nr:hypothetical protein [Rothia santali]MCP3426510.1 hypothetical protein [Rothia santali]
MTSSATPDEPRPDDATPDGAVPSPADHDVVRAPRAVVLLSVLVGLEAAALVLLGLIQIAETFFLERTMPVGAIVLMSLIYIGFGLWLGLAARAAHRGRMWPRALIILAQVFLVIISVQSAPVWGWPIAILPILYGLLVALILFSRPVQAHLLREARRVEG